MDGVRRNGAGAARIPLVQQRWMTVHSAAGVDDVVLEHPDDATVGGVRRALAAALGSAPAGRLWLGERALDPHTPLTGLALRDGAVLGWGVAPPVEKTLEPTGPALAAVTGPAAGSLLPLPLPLFGTLTLGRESWAALESPTVSRRHAVLSVTTAGITVADSGSTNGTTLDGRPVGPSPEPVRPGDLLTLGEVRLTVVASTAEPLAVEPGPDGSVVVRRPPRLPGAPARVRLQRPVRAAEREPRPVSVLTAAAPAVVGGLLAVALHQPAFALFAVLSPVLAAAAAVSDRRGLRRERLRHDGEYAAATAAFERDLAEAMTAESRHRRVAHPGAADLVATGCLPGRRLWERKPGDGDHLVVRLGTGPGTAAAVSIAAEGREHPPVVPDVPLTVSLAEVGVLGIAGPEHVTSGVLRWLLVQLAVLHPPDDLRMTVLRPPDGGDAWWRWLPHLRRGSLSVSIATDRVTGQRRIDELLAELGRRSSEDGLPGRAPTVVTVVDLSMIDPAVLAPVLEAGPAAGLLTVCTAAEERLLPSQCRAVAIATGPDHLTVRRPGRPADERVAGERITSALAGRVARAMAPLRIPAAAGAEEPADPPGLLPLLDLDPPTAEAVRRRWERSTGDLCPVVGTTGTGTLRLDLDRDGPHVLMAGTTGSGKSELLQTTVAAVAASHSPAEVSFVLVDYKGGSAFRRCAELPHTVGMVTDLDDHLVGRALASLTAELKRRERLLHEAGCDDLRGYRRLARLRPDLPMLARLVVVVDEFAALALELPQFVSGLVSLAQRGRSLGMHLVLATQRPAGVISPEIKANVNLRIALRTTDPADSVDIVGVPAAARIASSAPGSGILRSGHGAAVRFRAARIARPAPAACPAPDAVRAVRCDGTQPVPGLPPREAPEGDRTDLDLLVDAARAAAAGQPVPPSPWLPPLPDVVRTEDLLPARSMAERLPFGLTDLPHLQRREPLTFDLSHDGHLMVVGTARSGRSSALLALAGAAVRALPPDRLHLHALDCGSGALSVLRGLPHAGAVVGRAEPERAARLLDRLAAELDLRQRLAPPPVPAAAAEPVRPPHVLVLIDQWEGFLAALGEVEGGRLLDVVLRLAREGAGCRIHLAVSGDRSLAAHRLATVIERRLALRLADRGDYSLLGLNPRTVPHRMPPGRVVAADTGVESQLVLAVLPAVGAGSPVARARPFTIDPLPDRVDPELLWGHPRRVGGVPALIGLGGDELTALGPDVTATPAFLIAGPHRSGRSAVLAGAARSLLRQNAAVVVAAPPGSPLSRLEGPAAVLDGRLAGLDDWQRALAGVGDGRPTGSRHVVVVVDDAEGMRDCAGSSLLAAIARGAVPGHSLVMAGHIDHICTGLSGWQVEVQRRRQGLVLGARVPDDGRVIGVRLPRGPDGRVAARPGRGWLQLGEGRPLLVAVPTSMP